MSDVTLREYIERHISGLETEMKTRLDAMDKALLLQSKQYDVHLDALNNEQARLAADRASFVTKEIFEEHRKELYQWRDGVNEFRSENAGRDRGIGLSWSVLLAVGGILVGMLVAWFSMTS